MESIEVRIAASGLVQDIVVAEIGDLPVVGCQNEEACLLVYFQGSAWNRSLRARLEKILMRCGLSGGFEERTIEAQNWNRLWEESFQPVRVGPFLVRPSWSESLHDSSDVIELIVDPKMSFGTGHHETTRLMLRHLLANSDHLTRVLDAGTGTGILAIAAARLGASSVLAFDTDPWCITNTGENLRLNKVSGCVRVLKSSLASIADSGFSMILANINKNVLIGDIPGYARRLEPGGRLALSGILKSDRDDMLRALSQAGMEQVSELDEGEWWSVTAALMK